MKTIKYKTLPGLLSQTRQLTVEEFLNGRFNHKKKGWINFKLDSNEYKKTLKAFSEYCFSSKKAQNNLFYNLVNDNFDSSFFQSFYIEKNCFSNSLSGEGFNYCLRNYYR